MTKQKAMPADLLIWVDARKKFHLSHAQIQMAREMGLNPKKFGKLANHKQEPWKEPLPNFIETIYYKRFSKERPDEVKTIEQIFKLREEKKRNQQEAKKKRKALEADLKLNQEGIKPTESN